MMTIPESTYTIILIVAIVILFTVFIVGLIKSLRAGSTRRAAIPALTLGFLLCVYLLFKGREIGPADWAQIVLLFSLVVVTGVYALSTAR